MSVVMRWMCIVLCVVASASFACARQEAPAGFDHAHKAWTVLLGEHVKDDAFDYKKLKTDTAKLEAYLRTLEAVEAEEFASWDSKQQFAFWINAYNAYTVKLVVDAYPIASIKDLGDEKLAVWDREFIPLGALAPTLKREKLSLNDVENKILRPVFKDARVHAAINCASESCPPLQNEAFRAEKLEEQLTAQTKRWLLDTTRNRFDKAAGKLELSQVFDWFKADFEREAGSAQAWIAKFLPTQAFWLDTKKKYDVRFLDYSWKLNQAP
jgi:hypothetical protein